MTYNRIDKNNMTFDPEKGWVSKPGKKQPKKQTDTRQVPAEIQEPAGQKKTGEEQKPKKKAGES